MPLKKRILDIMVPIVEYATTREDGTLKKAVLDMRKIYCKAETGEVKSSLVTM